MATTVVVQAVGIVGASISAGVNFASTIVTIPALLQSEPRLLSRQWLTLYEKGTMFILPLVLSSTAAFGYLAYGSVRSSQSMKSKLYGGAAVAVLSQGVYTQLVMMGTIKALQKLAAPGVSDHSSVHPLVRKWSDLNLIRAFLPLSAALLGISSAFA